ncbi:MAG: hypothetical protein WC757_03655 [Candidatus Paceibacterota bacterium]|jgi:hypothetical protein
MEKFGQQLVENTTEDTTEKILPSYMEMYEISGQDSITLHSYERYLRDKEKAHEIASEILESAPFLRKKIFNSPESERASIIREQLSTDNPIAHKASSAMIWAAPENEREGLRVLLGSRVLESFKGTDTSSQREYAWMIWDAPLEQRTEIIRMGMSIKHELVQEPCTRMIEYAPKTDRAELISEGLASENYNVKLGVARMIWSAEESQQSKLKSQVAEMVSKGFEGNNTQEHKACASMIIFAPESEREGFRNKLAELIKNCFQGGNIDEQKEYARVINQAPSNLRKELRDEAVQKLGNALVEPSLYKNKRANDESFSREDFEKTGSELTVVGGDLRSKTIIRHIESESFIVWEKLFENHSLWKGEGFDYVPVEPIQAFKLSKDGLIDVYSGVLDLNLDEWKGMDGTFITELKQDKEKIVAVLAKVGLNHGHYHDGNFCLRFFRNENGVVDFNRKPRLYLIDFDQAMFPIEQQSNFN